MPVSVDQIAVLSLECSPLPNHEGEMKMKIRSYVVFCLAVSLSLVSGTAIAQQISDNWNTEVCSFTDHAGFELQERTRLTSIELWYHWGRRESEVGYALFHEGEPVKRGRLMRGACDINQEAGAKPAATSASYCRAASSKCARRVEGCARTLAAAVRALSRPSERPADQGRVTQS